MAPQSFISWFWPSQSQHSNFQSISKAFAISKAIGNHGYVLVTTPTNTPQHPSFYLKYLSILVRCFSLTIRPVLMLAFSLCCCLCWKSLKAIIKQLSIDAAPKQCENWQATFSEQGWIQEKKPIGYRVASVGFWHMVGQLNVSFGSRQRSSRSSNFSNPHSKGFLSGQAFQYS